MLVKAANVLAKDIKHVYNDLSGRDIGLKAEDK
jgi:hypothetical protein